MQKSDQIPHELKTLHAFIDSIDLRNFIHHGVQHAQADAIADPVTLATWMAARDLGPARAKIAPSKHRDALALRSALRAFVQCDDDERRRDKAIRRALNVAFEPFPLVARLNRQGDSTLRALREDALAGLSAIVAEFHASAANGMLDRLKMCAADECLRVFYDRSKPGTRRWCLSTLCGNREKTRTYRARQQGKK